MMKRSIATACPVFNTNRMVQEYVEQCYYPSGQRFSMLTADNLKRAAELARWRQRLLHVWPQVRVEAVFAGRVPVQERPLFFTGTNQRY